MGIIEPTLTVIDAWKEFERNVVPHDCPRAQRRTLMFAFYIASLTMADRLLATDSLTAYVDAKRECQEMANAIEPDEPYTGSASGT